jgi:hypothetical protein
MQTNDLLIISQVAALLGIRKHRLEYAITSGYIPEPSRRFLGNRVFSPAEVRIAAAYFGTDTHDCVSPLPQATDIFLRRE